MVRHISSKRIREEDRVGAFVGRSAMKVFGHFEVSAQRCFPAAKLSNYCMPWAVVIAGGALDDDDDG